jgi:hypothetical protein
MRRRLRFAILVIISQALLVALAISWFIHMLLIEMNGSVFFVEQNPVILWAEIVVTVLIILFSGFILIIQIKRLNERRINDRRVNPENRKTSDLS